MGQEAQMKIRIEGALKALIEAAAERSNRSLNAEIVQRLEASFRDDAPLEERLTGLSEQVENLAQRVRMLEHFQHQPLAQKRKNRDAL